MSTLIRPFFGYYGGKWRDTPRLYPPPEYPVIIEPFAGSAGYSVRYYDRLVVLCDLDPVIAGVWDYLIKVTPQEVLAIPDVPLDGCVDDLGLCQEASWLVGFWLNRGVAAPCKTPSAWMRKGIRPGSFWGPKVRRRIASQVGLIRHWRVSNRSYEESSRGLATRFVDPPYQVAGKHYRHGSKGIDYEHLGSWCQGQEGQTIVCEGPGADWLPFRDQGLRKTARKTPSMERVWLNY